MIKPTNPLDLERATAYLALLEGQTRLSSHELVWRARLRWLIPQLVLIVVAGLAAGACSFIDAQPSPGDATAIALIDITPSGLATAAEQRRHLDDVVIPLAAEHRAEVVLAVIDGNARDDPRVLARASFDTRSAGGNGVVAEDIVRDATNELRASVDELFSGGSTATASDVAGAVSWATETLRATGDEWRAIAVLGDAVATAGCNLTLTPPSVDLAASITACYPNGVPDFVGTEVWFLGAGVDPFGSLGPSAVHGIEQFWRSVVATGGGTIGAYGATILGVDR